MKLLNEKPTKKAKQKNEKTSKKASKHPEGKRLDASSDPKPTVVPRHWAHRRPTAKDIGFFVGPIVAVAIVAGLLFYFQDTRNSYTLEVDGAQYYRGTEYVIAKGTVLHREEEAGDTMLPVGDYEYSISNLPIYYEGDHIVLPEDMLHYDPRSNTFSYLPYFSEVYQDGNRTLVSRDGQEVEINAGFLFDGKDTYIFLEEVTLYFNGYAIYLPAYSYVESVYSYEVTSFNYAAMESLSEPPIGSVTVKPMEDVYEVSLVSDMVSVTNGVTALLHTQPNLLESVF